jgi:hypothetical protein
MLTICRDIIQLLTNKLQASSVELCESSVYLRVNIDFFVTQSTTEFTRSTTELSKLPYSFFGPQNKLKITH